MCGEERKKGPYCWGMVGEGATDRWLRIPFWEGQYGPTRLNVKCDDVVRWDVELQEGLGLNFTL